MVRRWRLQKGDRVVFWDRGPDGCAVRLGTISFVDPTALFFAYWVDWDEPNAVGCEGGFQSSCFDWEEMERRGMRPNRDEKKDPDRCGGRVRITLELLDQGGEPVVLEMDDFDMVEELGIHRHSSMSEIADRLSSNGMARVKIRAWRGCRSFDHFQKETKSTGL